MCNARQACLGLICRIWWLNPLIFKDVPSSKNLMMQALAKKGLAHRLWGKGWELSPLGWQVFQKLNDRNMEGKNG